MNNPPIPYVHPSEAYTATVWQMLADTLLCGDVAIDRRARIGMFYGYFMAYPEPYGFTDEIKEQMRSWYWSPRYVRGN